MRDREEPKAFNPIPIDVRNGEKFPPLVPQTEAEWKAFMLRSLKDEDG